VTKLVLASTSPARLRLLRDGGIQPITISPEVDEELLTEQGLASGEITNTQDMVLLLAQAKAEAVLSHPDAQGALIIGCDSSLDLDGEALGKPHDPEVAIERWKSMRGRSGRLYTGHWLIDNRDPANPKAQGQATNTTVHFANLSDSEILAYVGTGEPLKVAGAFTIDGLGGAFIRAIEGDTHTVVGLSLPTLRELCIKLGVDYPSLWSSK
jgi:septum formation protein